MGTYQNIVIIPNRIMFSVLRKTPRSSGKVLYFTVENEPQFQYRPFFNDFGPPSLIQIYSFVRMIEEYISKSSNMLHFYVTPNPTSKTHAALYISAF